MAGVSGFGNKLNLIAEVGTGTVTSITGTAPITVTPSPLTTTGVISFTPPGSDTQVMYNNAGALAGDADLTWNNSTNFLNATGGFTIATDVMMRRGAANNLRLGPAPAASPSAQTLSVQNVLTGTTDTAGASWTLTGSQGTGTGAGGSLIFQTAPAGSTGSAQNALVTALTINSGAQSLFANGAVALPTIVGAVDATSGMWFRAAGSVSFTLSGSHRFEFAGSQFRGGSNATIGWSSATAPTAAADAIMTRKGAANIQLGAADAASPVAQTLSVQSVVTGTSNTAGANRTYAASQSTGDQAGGSHVFTTSPAGSSGTSVNALTTVFTLNTTAAVVASGKNFQLGNAATTGLSAGVLAALTNASVVIYDSTGQAYRIPCII